MRIRKAKLLLVTGGVLAIVLYYLNATIFYVGVNTFNPYNGALVYLAKAGAAQTPGEIIRDTNMAKQELVKTGYVSWWSTGEDELESVQAELDDIIIRAKNISSLAPENEEYISEIYYIHDRISVIQQSLLAV